MAAPPVRSLALTIRAPLRRADLGGLMARTCRLLDPGDGHELHCHVDRVAADAVAADALARLALAARRRGCHVCVLGADEALGGLIVLMGLADVLRIEGVSNVSADR